MEKEKKKEKSADHEAAQLDVVQVVFVLVTIAIMRPFYTRRSQAIKIDIVNQSIWIADCYRLIWGSQWGIALISKQLKKPSTINC